MRTKPKNIVMKICIFVFVLIVITLLAKLAYAKYTTSLGSKSSADIAIWSFKVNGKTNEHFIIDLATTRKGIQQEAEVNDSYIAPGTAGMFIIEVDATESEVSLEYNIKMGVDYTDNEKFPQNLIFYSDSEMINAIYHTDNFINLNGYIAQNDENKKKKHIIYWKWDFETGQSQKDIDDNNTADSFWIGNNISIPITVVGEQVNQNSTQNQYTVTFDANGGIIKGYGNAGVMTKNVTYNSVYGELPEPTKEGYTFAGWSKNLLSNIETGNPGYTWGAWDGERLVLDNSSSGNTGSTMLKLQFYKDNSYIEQVYTTYITGNRRYTFVKNNTFNKLRLAINGSIEDASSYIYCYNLQDGKTYTLSFKVEILENFHAEITNIQIEEGSIVTPYMINGIEPNTTVTQQSDHTLVAKWVKK